MAAGAYSSIFIASPLLALLKEREPRYRALRNRIEGKTGKDATKLDWPATWRNWMLNAAERSGAASNGSGSPPGITPRNEHRMRR